MEADRNTLENDKDDEALITFRKFLGSSGRRFFLLLAMAVVLASGFGELNAMKKTYFYIPSVRNESVVLRIYGDRVVCSNVDRVNKTVSDEIFVFSISNTSGISLKKEKIGPLKSSSKH